MAATCGQCGARDQTIVHVRRCYEAAKRGESPAPLEYAKGNPRGTAPDSLSPAKPEMPEVVSPSPPPAFPAPAKRKRSKPQSPRRKPALRRSDRTTRELPKVTDFRKTPPGALPEDDARKKYPSGATKVPVDGEKASSPKAQRPTSRGGRNFTDYGMVNPPPTRKPSTRDY